MWLVSPWFVVILVLEVVIAPVSAFALGWWFGSETRRLP